MKTSLKSLLAALNALRPSVADLQHERDELAAAFTKLSTENLLLQDRLDAALSERTRLWEVMRESLAGEREALRMQVNYASQQKFGIAPYPDAAKLPDSCAAQPDIGGASSHRMSGGDAVRQKSADFLKQYAARNLSTRSK